jgi:hypothetical protein
MTEGFRVSRAGLGGRGATQVAIGSSERAGNTVPGQEKVGGGQRLREHAKAAV